MKKIFLCGIIFISSYLILSFCYVDKSIEDLSSSSSIDIQTTKIEYQKNLDVNVRNYLKEYTFSKPKVIVGRDDSPISVQVIFSTKKDTSIKLEVFKDEEFILSKKFDKSKEHVLNITGLIAGEKNTLYMTDDNNNIQKLEVEIPKISLNYINLIVGEKLSDSEIYLYASPMDKAIIGIDNKMRVRYYLKNYMTPYLVNSKGYFLTVDEQTTNSLDISRALLRRKFNGEISQRIEIEGGLYSSIAESSHDYIVISPNKADDIIKLKKISKGDINNVVSKDIKRSNISPQISQKFKIYVENNTIILIDYGNKKIYLIDLNTLEVKKSIDLSRNLDDFRVLSIEKGKLILERISILKNENNTLINFAGEKDKKILDLETEEIKDFTGYLSDLITNNIVEDIRTVSIDELNNIKTDDKLEERYIKLEEEGIKGELAGYIDESELYNIDDKLEKFFKLKYTNTVQSVLAPTTKDYVDRYKFSAALNKDGIFNEKLINIYRVSDYIVINAIVLRKDKINIIIKKPNSDTLVKYPINVEENYKIANNITKEYTGNNLKYVYIKDIKKVKVDSVSNVYIEINGRIYNIHRFILPSIEENNK